MITDFDSDHFRAFAKSLEYEIDKYKIDDKKDFDQRQKEQIEGLCAAEDEFRDALNRSAQAAVLYQKFIDYICDEEGNILAARPYYRERQEIFTEFISQVLKDRNPQGLYGYHGNYHFITFILRNGGNEIPALVEAANRVKRKRRELVEQNLPLAINRARIFWTKTPRAQLTYMDLVQIATEGLIAAVDKYVLPYTPVFRSVAIGRMVGNFIEQYSETLVHFYPSDKRKLYRANKALSRFAGEEVDFEELALIVNQGSDRGHKTDATEIALLLAASSCSSTDMYTKHEGNNNSYVEHGENVLSDEEQVWSGAHFEAEDSIRPDVKMERVELDHALQVAFKKLTLVEQKFLRLKGVSL